MMQATIWQFLLVCPLVGLAGFVDAVAGGGGLISLPAYLIAGVPVHNAIGTNKVSSAMGTAVATWRYVRSGYVRWRLAVLCMVCAWCGSDFGANLALRIADGAFRMLMLVILPLTGAYVFRCKALKETDDRPAFAPAKTAAHCMGCALVIGCYDGFYGPGTGTFLLLSLTGLAHLPLRQANGIAKVINLSTNLAALAVYLLNGKAWLPLGAVAGCFGMAGNYIGTCFFDKKGSKSVKPLMLLVLGVFFCKVVWELIFGIN